MSLAALGEAVVAAGHEAPNPDMLMRDVLLGRATAPANAHAPVKPAMSEQRAKSRHSNVAAALPLHEPGVSRSPALSPGEIGVQVQHEHGQGNARGDYAPESWSYASAAGSTISNTLPPPGRAAAAM